MYNKKIEEYKETDKKEKLWEEIGVELGFTGRHKLNFYLLLVFCRAIVVVLNV